jgi:lysophospholipase L1-like esterase
VTVAHEGGPKMTRGVIKIALLLILAIVAWGHGLAVGHYAWPPFFLIQSAVRATQDVPVVTLSYYDMRAPILAAFPQKGQIAMVGDSLTELAPWNGMFPNEEIANYGISGDTVEGVLARVPSILASRASKMLVMIGINNLRKGQSVSSIVPTYRTLVEALGRDGAQVFVESTLCTSATDLNMRVSELNAELRMFCTMKPERCEFIQVIDTVCPPDQSPVDSSLTVDGVHLSPLGYERWRNAIAQYVRAK